MEFFLVYLREAHPTDGWQVDANVADNILFCQHQSLEEREEVAGSCVLGLQIETPTLIEEIDNGIDDAYGTAPVRQYIWNAHAVSGRREGLVDGLVDALRDNRPLPALAADEAAVINLGMEFFKTHKISQQTFQAVLDRFGRQGFAELTTLMGYYAMLSFNANAVELDLPSERAEAVLPI